jgi:hypothetical protein
MTGLYSISEQDRVTIEFPLLAFVIMLNRGHPAVYVKYIQKKKPSNTTKVIYYMLHKATSFDPAVGHHQPLTKKPIK